NGPGGACTTQDHERDRACQVALAANAPAWRDLAAEVARQRLAPLIPHLEGIRHLIVLPSRGLAAIPVEAIFVALPEDSPCPVVSYAPAGSMPAHLNALRPAAPGPLRLLALGDPGYSRPGKSEPPPAPPDHGLAIIKVLPNSTAEHSGIKAGDVLLEY